MEFLFILEKFNHFYIKLSIKNAEGKGYSEEKIKISLEKDSKVFFENYYITDKTGKLEFDYDPNDCDLCKDLVISPKPGKYFLKV